MCRKMLYLFLALVFLLALSAHAQNIVWLSETNADADLVYFDQGWIDLLEDAGYTVHFQPGEWMTLDADNLAILESADLIIASRNSNSGNYATDAAEIAQWNSVPTPLIMMTAYWVRSNRWLWINSTTIEEYSPEAMLQVVDSTHPVFKGVTPVDGLVDVIDETVNNGENSFVITNDVGNGILIAQREDNEAVWIAEWLPGMEFYDGSTQIPAEKRMLFLAGGGGGQEAGSFNLTEDGIKIFFNTVDYMLGAEPRLKAFVPKPSHAQKDVTLEPVLSWRAGSLAETHNVYFGKVLEDVNEADITEPRGVLVSQNQDDTTYNPGLLEFGQKYYWRVDEVNAPPDSTVYKGDTWSFTLINYHVVDDFEDYNDYSPYMIFETWIDGWGVDTNGALIGHDADFSKGEHIVETTIVHSGEQSMPFYYDNDMKYSQADMTLTSGLDWTRDGVTTLSLWHRGYMGDVGSFTEDPAGTYTMTATGVDVWGTSDEFHFAFKELTSAGSIIVKIESVEQTDPWAKAGVMIRDTLDADSIHAMVVVTPAQGVSFQRRSTAGASSFGTDIAGIMAPQWVKIERNVGGAVTASYSDDGSSWIQIGSEGVSMNIPMYIGLAVTSHNAGEVCEAKFSNVSITGTVSGQWMNQDIGITSNTAEQMYVVLNGSAAVPHDNPNAALITEWTEWNIDLQKFADQGVNLANVETIGIGFGDRDNPQPGGSGIVYIDDIRLYLPRPVELPVIVTVESPGF